MTSVYPSGANNNNDINENMAKEMSGKIRQPGELIEQKKKRTMMDELLVDDHHHAHHSKWILRKFYKYISLQSKKYKKNN
jgi:hypothetical protein